MHVRCEQDLRCYDEAKTHKSFILSSPSQAPLYDYLIRTDSPLLHYVLVLPE